MLRSNVPATCFTLRGIARNPFAELSIAASAQTRGKRGFDGRFPPYLPWDTQARDSESRDSNAALTSGVQGAGTQTRFNFSFAIIFLQTKHSASKKVHFRPPPIRASFNFKLSTFPRRACAALSFGVLNLLLGVSFHSLPRSLALAF